MAALGMSPHACVHIEGVGSQPLIVSTACEVLYVPDEETLLLFQT